MKHRFLAGLVAAAVVLGWGGWSVPPVQAADDVSVIVDPVLQQCIIDELVVLSGTVKPDDPEYDALMTAVETAQKNAATGVVTQADLDTFVAVDERASQQLGGEAGDLDCDDGVKTLAGLENLRDPNVWRFVVDDGGPNAPQGSIVDVAPLKGLTSINWLELSNNQIVDLGPLSSLTKLTLVNLRYNLIENLSPLAGLPKVLRLEVDGNPISELLPLGGGVLPATIEVAGDRIADISGPSLTCTDAETRVDLAFIEARRQAYESHGSLPYPTGEGLPNCARVIAPFQTLSSLAQAGSPVPLPEVVGQVDDPPVWRVAQGDATLHGDGTVTYPQAGTYILQFQDATTPENTTELRSGTVPDEATCALHNGVWGVYSRTEREDPFGLYGTGVPFEGCQIAADFSGIVHVTVTSADLQQSQTHTVTDVTLEVGSVASVDELVVAPTGGSVVLSDDVRPLAFGLLGALMLASGVVVGRRGSHRGELLDLVAWYFTSSYR